MSDRGQPGRENLRSYDQAGNTLTRTSDTGTNQTMTWDREGHLATSTAAGRTTTYLYTADGDRLLARATGKTTLYLGDTEIELSAGTTTGTRYYAIGGTVIAVRTTNGVSEADAAGLAGQPADDLDSAAGLTEGAFDEVRTPDAVPGREASSTTIEPVRVPCDLGA